MLLIHIVGVIPPADPFESKGVPCIVDEVALCPGDEACLVRLYKWLLIALKARGCPQAWCHRPMENAN